MSFIDELKFTVSSVAEDADKGFKVAASAAEDLGDSYDRMQEIQERARQGGQQLVGRMREVESAMRTADIQTGKMPGSLRQMTTAFKSATSGAGAFAIAMIGVQLVVGIFKKIADAAKQAKEDLAKLTEEANKMASGVGAATALVDRYEELQQQVNRTSADTAEMASISQQLVGTYGLRADAVDAEGKLILTSLDYMKEQLEIQRELTLLKLEEAEKKGADDLAKSIEKMVTAKDGIDYVVDKIAELKAVIAEPWDETDWEEVMAHREAIASLEAFEATYVAFQTNIGEGNKAVMERIEQSTQLALLRMGDDAADVTIEMQNKVTQDMRAKAASGGLFGAAEIEAALRDYLATGVKAIEKTAEELAEEAAMARAAATDTKKMTAAIGGLNNAFTGLSKEIGDTNDLQMAVDVIRAGETASEDYALALDYLAGRYGVSREEVEANIDTYARDAEIKATLLELNILLAQAEALAAQETIEKMVAAGTATKEQAAKMITAIDGVINKLNELSGAEGLGSIGIDTDVIWRAPRTTARRATGGSRKTATTARDTALADRLAQLDRLRRANQITADEEIAHLWRTHDTLARTTEDREKVYARILQAQKDSAQQAYDIDVYYGRRTLERQREQVRQQIRQHKAGTDARIALEEQLYQVMQEIRERDTQSMERIGGAVVTALQNRYEAQREAETAAIEASMRAWRDWADIQVEAINDQLRALDELNRDEDRADEERRRRRKVAALEQQRQYETDAYNQRKLDEQIEKEKAELDKWLARIEREDMRDELTRQAEQIQARADQEERALNDQLDALERYYADRTKDHLLEAEAERLIVRGSQNEIVDLIRSFAPEYDAAGRTLGERLYAGFTDRAADIGLWFEAVNRQLETYQAQMANTATAAALQFWATHGTPTAQPSVADPGSVQSSVPPIVINMYDLPDSPAKFASELERMLDRLSRS